MLTMPENVDVIICGSGSAGLCAAVWLARRGINYKILERRSGPLRTGQADGVQCRTVEIFESFNISEDLLKEAYHVLELAFWAADESVGGIKRTSYAADTEPGLSHQPHVILNQARINGLMLEEIERSSGSIEIEYGVEVRGVTVDEATSKDPEAYCVTTTALQSGVERIYRSKYVLACDGAHSAVRKSLGIKMIGDTSDAVWGVMDIYVKTNFPDIRKKVVIHADAGNIVIIPREGDSMVRFYIELHGEDVKNVTLLKLQGRAKLIFSPYFLEFAETPWWSAYSIGQRLADNFSRDHRVFLTGDACHTHSPKAGQGMNVSLQDGYNLGWKLASILRKESPSSLLETYVSERQKTAEELIEFDRTFTKMFSSSYRQEHGITPDDFTQHFVKSGRYTAGQGIKYEKSLIVAPDPEKTTKLSSIVVGMRFPSAQVVRYSDARAMQLARALPADGRWHIVVFSGDILDKRLSRRIVTLADELRAIAKRYTLPTADIDSVIQNILVFSSKRHDVEVEHIPELFTPTTGKWKMKSLHNVFADDESWNSGHGRAYQAYRVGPDQGCLVVVRPDHYVAMVASLEASDQVARFFDEVLISPTTS